MTYFVGERENQSVISSTLEANISSLRESPDSIMVEDSLTSAIENKSYANNSSSNPFEEYDESKNPFFSDSPNKDEDDYDKTLNPFA